MFHAFSRLIRRAALVAAAALGVLAISTVSAQTNGRGAAASTATGGQAADTPVLNPSHPDRYVVKRGDTLWDIAGMFLRDPWYWPEIWQVNPQIQNPHLIYPGDVLSLAYVGGRPVIRVQRGPNAPANPVEKLSPRVRSEPLEQAIPTIPYETIRSFLNHPTVLDRKQIKTLPYVLALREGLIGSAGNDLYVRGTGTAAVGAEYSVVQVGDPLVDPDDNAVVGYEGIYVGKGRLRRSGDPATLRLTATDREALVGDLLLHNEETIPVNFLPRAPSGAIEGRIISVVDGVSLIGQYQIVVINRGARDGLEPGNVLRAFKTGEVVRDNISGRSSFGEKVKLPDEPAGLMMVFRVFDRISYALIMEATSAISVQDTVRNP